MAHFRQQWSRKINGTRFTGMKDILIPASGGSDASNIAFLNAANVFSSNMKIAGTNAGGLAIGGDFYNHVLVAVGLNGNPLTETHQVGVYSALKANSIAAGAGSFNAGFETAIGTQAGAFTLEACANFAIGSLTKGAGSTITRSWGISTYDETLATNNATIALYNSTFTGDWFIHYDGTRKSKLVGGDLLVPPEIYRSSATSFIRLAGGDAAAAGANIILFGQTHATNPSKMQLNASGGIAVTGIVTFATYTAATWVLGDVYLVVDAAGVIHRSSIGPVS